VPTAMADRAGTMQLYYWSSTSMYSLTPSPTPGDESVSVFVDVSTLDRYVREHEHIDFLKTDTEGHDLDVLRGAEGLLRSGRIDTIVSEFGMEDADIEHTPLLELIAYLKPFGYHVVWFYEPDIRPAGKGVSAHHIDYGNVLFTRL
jgi:hypothetical protein